MSHRHSAQLQLYGHTEANLEQTWRTVETIIIAEQGNNAFLSHGTPHCKVRHDYIDTPTGIKRKLADLFI